MHREKTFSIITLALGVMLVFALAGCGGLHGGNNGGGSDPGDEGTAGKLTITNLPVVESFISVGVWDYDGPMTTKAEYDTVTVPSSIATSVGGSLQYTQPVSLYLTGTSTGFTGSGTFMVQISTGHMHDLDEPRYYGQIVFTNGDATVNYNNPTFHAGMLGGD